MKTRVYNVFAVATLLWLAGDLPLRAQGPPGNAANTPLDPIISQLVRMGGGGRGGDGGCGV